MAEVATPSVTRDSLFGGQLLLTQPVKGHRAGTDAVLLAAAVPHGFAGRVYDAGAGVGTVGLAVALVSPEARVTLIERDAGCAALAEANIAANGLETRVSVVVCDLLSREDRHACLPEPADLVVTNPPFYRADRVRASPEAGRRAAHVLAPESALEDWLLACLSVLSPKGTLILIHQAEALSDLLAGLDRRLGALTLMAVHPRAGQPATRILLRGIRGSRAPLEIAPPLVLFDGKAFTQEAARLHAGLASLDW